VSLFSTSSNNYDQIKDVKACGWSAEWAKLNMISNHKEVTMFF